MNRFPTRSCDVRVFRECQNLPRPDYPIQIPLHPIRPTSATPTMTATQLWQQLRSSTPPVVIDVREPREFYRGHIPQATLIPLPTFLDSAPELPTDRPIVFVCRSGRRSSRVAAMLHTHGHNRMMVLDGGMLAWEAAELLEAIEPHYYQEA